MRPEARPVCPARVLRRSAGAPRAAPRAEPSALRCPLSSPPLPSPSPVLPGRQGVRAAGPPSGACWRPESPSPDPWPWLCPRPRCRPSSEGSGGAGARAGLPAPGTDCTACPSPGPAPRAPCTSTAAPALSPSCTQRPRPSNGPAGSQGAPRGQRPLWGVALACPTQTGAPHADGTLIAGQLRPLGNPIPDRPFSRTVGRSTPPDAPACAWPAAGPAGCAEATSARVTRALALAPLV